MHPIATLTWLTFQEARRRRMALAALALGALFLLLFNIGFAAVINELEVEGESLVFQNQFYSVLLMAGLYVIHFLTVMLAIFASVDSVSGEITSHTIQALVTKPVRRWHIIFGKWLGFAAMLLLYVGLLCGGVILSVYVQTGYLPPNALQGVALLMFEALVLVSVSLFGGAHLSTLTNGVVLFMFYGLAFIGSWVEQIGAILQSQAAVRVGIIASLLLPVEAMWRRAAYLLQPPLSNNIPSPFSTTSVPSDAMVVYTAIYMLVMLALAMRGFGRRDL